MGSNLNLDMAKTALVIVDLQHGVVSLPTAPYASADVVRQAARLAEAFRERGAFVAAVNVDFIDGKDALKPITDQTPAVRSRPADASVLVPEIDRAKNLLVTKRQWGAFHGTELDLQLRRRGIDTIVLCGIATNIGVGVTAIEAYQLGYNQVFAADAMSALSADEHEFFLTFMFPRMGRVRSTDDILRSLR